MALQVALVDDEQVARTYVERMKLWREGEFALAISAASGRELLDALARTPVDIVLMDVFMPDVDGVSLSGELKRRYPQVDLVAISNFDGYDFVRPIMKNGAQDYLLKSRLTEDSLRELLRRLRDERARNGAEAAPYREQLRRFLQGEVSWPFPLDGSQPVACFGRLAEAASLTQEQRQAMQRGIEELLEEGASPTLRRTAVGYGQGLFLLLLRFYDYGSMAALQQAGHYLCAALSDSVGKVYKAHLTFEMGPVMSNTAALPPYILQRVRSSGELPPQELPTDRLSLKDTQRLLSLLASGDRAGLGQALEELLTAAQDRDMRERLFLTRNVLDLARSAAREWQLDLPMPPEGNALFAWMQSLSHPALIAQVCQLFDTLVTHHRQDALTRYSEPVRKAIAFLESRYGEAIGLAAAAQAAQVNESYLSRLFRKETGMTLGDYLTQLRLERAKALLREGRPIKEVAAQVGYVQYTHFLRVFKQKEGCTITQYLQNVKNG